jgi:hypothetical protein
MDARSHWRNSPERREARAAAWWLVLTIATFLPVPVYLAAVVAWIGFLRPRFVPPSTTGGVDRGSMVVVVGGLVVTGLAVGLLRRRAARAYADMRAARNEQILRAHLADLRGDGTELAQMRDRARILAAVPLIATAVGVLIALYVILR